MLVFCSWVRRGIEWMDGILGLELNAVMLGLQTISTRLYGASIIERRSHYFDIHLHHHVVSLF